MAASKQIYVADGATKQFTFAFPYLHLDHVQVFVNGVLQIRPLEYTVAGNVVTFKDAPGAGAAVEIKRNSSPNNPLVDFQNASVLHERELDLAYLHNFYLVQEATDNLYELINNTLIAIANGLGITETEPDAVIAALVNEMLSTAAANELQQRVNDIDANAEAILNLGEALQTQINTLAQATAAVVFLQPEAPVPGVGGVPDPIPEGARWYDSDDNNQPYLYQGGEWVSIEDPRIGDAVADIAVLQANVADNTAAILAEQVARANADSAFASTLALLGAETPDGQAFTLNLNTVQVGAGETLADRFTSINAATAQNAAEITAEQTARADADSALAADIALLQADVADNAAAILSEASARADGDSANASAISALTATVNGHTATISQHASAIATAQGDITSLEARYGVQLNVNGHITGFVQNNDGQVGSFVIVADKFAIVDPGDAGNFKVPFQYSGGVVQMQNVAINGSLLLNGTVITSKIAQNAITADLIQANAVRAQHILAGEITADKLNVSKLSAITADLGTVTGGVFRNGQTAFDTGTGFWLGNDAGTPKFSIGNATKALLWDGSNLRIRGGLITEGGMVNLSPYTAIEHVVAPGFGSITYSLQNNKLISVDGNNIENWLFGNGYDASDFDCRMLLVSGSLTSGTTGVWQNLATSRSWQVSRGGTVGTSSFTGTLQIRLSSTGEIVAQATISLSVVVDDPN